VLDKPQLLLRKQSYILFHTKYLMAQLPALFLSVMHLEQMSHHRFVGLTAKLAGGGLRH
jgi:hypothetical protein